MFRLGHAVAAHAVDFLLQLGLPFRVEAHGEDIRHQRRRGREQAREAEHANDVSPLFVIDALFLAGFQEGAHEGGRGRPAGADVLLRGVEGAEEELALALVAGALGAFPGGEPEREAVELGDDVGEVGAGGDGVEEGVGVARDGVGVPDVAEGEARDDASGVGFGDGGEVLGVGEELGEELVAFLEGEVLVRDAFGLAHDFVDEAPLAAPYICGESEKKGRD